MWSRNTFCKICFKVVSVPLSNTTNFFNHLKLNHKVIHDQVMKKQKDKSTTPTTSKQTSIKDTLYSATPYPSSSERHKKITDDIGFKKLVNTLDKRYVLPSFHHFSRVVLPTMYEKCRAEVAKEVTKAADFAVTSDLWSSRTMELYISLTIHYIDTDFNLRARCLQTAFIPEDHTGLNIAIAFSD